MENWNTIIVPTFYDETREFDRKKLKAIAEDSGLDIVTLKNAFIGKGIGFILKTSDVSKIEKAVKAFKNANIPCLPVNVSDVEKEIKVFKAKVVSPVSDGLKIESFDNNSFIIKEDIILVPDVSAQDISTVKKAIISSKKIALATKECVFLIDFERTRVLTPDGKKGISQKANLIQLLGKIKENGKLIIDSTFFYQGGFFRGDISRMAMFLAYAFKYGLYHSKLPQSLFVEIKERQKPIYRHKVIRHPIKTALYGYKLRLRDNVVYPPVFWISLFLFLVYMGARVREPVFFFAAFLLGFVICTFKLHRVWKTKVLIEDTPTSKLRSVAAGLVEVSGIITSPIPVVSPISGSPCVFFRYYKEVYVSGGRYSHWVLTEIGEGFAEDCILKDETGEIGVNVKNASYFLTNKYTTNQTFNEMRFSLFGADNVRYTEEYILDGQKVYVLGTAKPVSKSTSYGRFLSMLKKDKEKMRDFDLNGDGVIDNEEWEKAQKKLKDEYLEYKQLKGQAADLVIDRDPRNKVFIISNEKEHSILKRLKIALPLYFIGSLVCLVLTLWLTVKVF